mmetsp:Transcript_298/g.371  ORF Transcript_298/g.371 Transcript_298/m.371 type:complete len:269 (+) Transcript_298:36-842(+)
MSFRISAVFSQRSFPLPCVELISSFKTPRRCYVRELDWCAPRNTPKKKWSNTEQGIKCTNIKNEKIIHSNSFQNNKFGIVAAMSQNNVIGIDGKLPWHIPEDREYFLNLTRGKILIIGRRTFEEENDLSHISHVRRCIVVSKTMDPILLRDEKVTVAQSFTEALEMACKISILNREGGGKQNESSDIDCWVGGGEKLYEDALLHSSAQELHLTVVDTEIDLKPHTTFFPSFDQWKHKFREISRHDGKDVGGDLDYKCTFHIYKRHDSQ